MILYLTIAIIAWLALTAVYFIVEAGIQADIAKHHESVRHQWFKNWRKANNELLKYLRPRDSHGRFTK